MGPYRSWLRISPRSDGWLLIQQKRACDCTVVLPLLLLHHISLVSFCWFVGWKIQLTLVFNYAIICWWNHSVGWFHWCSIVHELLGVSAFIWQIVCVDSMTWSKSLKIFEDRIVLIWLEIDKVAKSVSENGRTASPSSHCKNIYIKKCVVACNSTLIWTFQKWNGVSRWKTVEGVRSQIL